MYQAFRPAPALIPPLNHQYAEASEKDEQDPPDSKIAHLNEQLSGLGNSPDLRFSGGAATRNHNALAMRSARCREEWMDKPRIFLGSSGKQAKLLQALTRGLEEVAHVEPWTTSFNPGTTTLEWLLELTREVDFAAFVFARDDWTANSPPGDDSPGPGQASPRDNVVFEAGLFGGVLGMRRTFILHASGAKLPSDLLGLTCVRYGDAATPAEMRVVNQKLRTAIENEWGAARVEGLWWQHSLTERSSQEPSAISLLQISRDRDGALEVTGRSWQEDGTLSARYSSEAAKERKDPSGVFYYWKGERPRDPNAPQVSGTGEIRLESADRASGYWTTRSETDPKVYARTSGVYLRADSGDLSILDGRDERRRAELIAEQLTSWKSATGG
jgi:predicted nucleotide-binding protein